MIVVVAVLGVVLLGCLAVFQLLLVAGAPLGRFAMGGQHTVLPLRLRIATVGAIALYAVFAVLMLQAAGAVDVLPDGFADVGIWVLAAYLAIGVVMNAVSRSRPERMVMTPVALVLTSISLVLALQ